MNATNPAWAELLPDEDFRFHFGLKPGDAAAFFARTREHASLIQQRQHWLEQAPQACAALLPEGAPLLQETLVLARQWQTLPEHAGDIASPPPSAEPPDVLGRVSPCASGPSSVPAAGKPTPANSNPALQRCLALGRVWEPDFLLLKPDTAGQFRLVAACVCFPSSWRLSEKIGQPLEAIHAPVPSLNSTLGRSIHQFLAKLQPGPAWRRANWGLSRSPELNQHPDRNLPRLMPPLTLDEVWLRIEHQALVALPETGGILFGIRLEMISLTEVKLHAEAKRGLLRALRTMPEEIAAYKNLAAARADLRRLLQ